MPFFVIFIVIPFIELAVFAAVSEDIGIFTTLILAFSTAILGGALVRHQGLRTILALRISLSEGKLPLNELFDGFCLVAAGALLITPGFVTDACGFLLLVPAFRNLLRHIIKTYTEWAIHGELGQNFQNRDQSGDIIEGEFVEIDDNKES